MLVSRFTDGLSAQAAYRRIRYTWVLMLASTVPLYAFPLALQLIFDDARGGTPVKRFVMDDAPATLYFSPIETYFPLIIAATFTLMGHAPTQARFFGSHYRRMSVNLDDAMGPSWETSCAR